MLSSSEIIKSLWIKYHGDVKSILKAIKDKEEISESTKSKKELANFDAQYDSIVVTDEAYDRINPRFAHLVPCPGIATTLIRWNRKADFMNRLLNCYNQTAFILDDDIESYILPEGLMAIGLYVDKDGFHLMSEKKTEILTTQYFDEIIWFISAACRHLVVGSKGLAFGADKKELLVNQREAIFDAYAAKKSVGTIMIVPGKSGCYSNKCLKKIHCYANTRFVDCWGDIMNIIDNEVPCEE